MNIKHIFFDLDHTLWDFERNSKLTFECLFEKHQISLNLADFLQKYIPINVTYWKLYREEKISKSDLRYGRLKDTFDELSFSVTDDFINQLAIDYIDVLPTKNYLFEGAIELLEYLHQKYNLHIITNGFEEVQNLKLQKSGIDKYFKEVITSESVGVKKPNPLVFEFALKKAKALAIESCMIGDNLEADVFGAINCGISSIHFNVGEKDTKQKEYIVVSNLLEIKQYI